MKAENAIIASESELISSSEATTVGVFVVCFAHSLSDKLASKEEQLMTYM